jgi:hypothetical protein
MAFTRSTRNRMPASRDAEPYRSFPDVVRFPAGEGRELVYSPLARAGLVLAPQTVRWLTDCGELATAVGAGEKMLIYCYNYIL